MEARETTLPGALVLVPAVIGDERGFFQETCRRDALRGGSGITDDFVQDNHSRSARGVLRGMHLQVGDGIAKLVRCARGEILDVIVDVRHGSPTYGRWEAFTLDDRDHHHGSTSRSGSRTASACSARSPTSSTSRPPTTTPRSSAAIAYDDPDLAIAWPAGSS